MSPYFILLFSILVTQRLGELVLAKRNTKWIQEQGGVEVGQSHYKYIVMIHVGFLLSLLGEVLWGEAQAPTWFGVPFLLFSIIQIARYWCIYSLGTFWNTRIFILPEHSPIKKGPYRWVKHPNYLIVMVELLVFPLIFGAYYSAVIWSVVNFAFLTLVRIPVEERALQGEFLNTVD